MCFYRDICRLLLFNTKSMEPTPKKEIMSMLKDTQFAGKKSKYIFSKVIHKLDHVFGFEYKQFGQNVYLRIKKNSNENEDDKEFKLRKNLINLDKNNYKWRGLVMFTLGVICLKGGEIKKQEFENMYLGKLNVESNFGDIKTIINKLKKEKWIQQKKDMDGDDIFVYGIKSEYHTNQVQIYRGCYKICNKNYVNSSDQAYQRLLGEQQKKNKKIKNNSRQ